MPTTHKYLAFRQAGFSLVEIMVGLVIGLFATLVIMQVFAVFEGQKRSTTGSADAQTNGSIALYSIQREALMAGYGLPVFDTNNPPLLCAAITPAGTDISPANITDGGAAGGSDTIGLRYATSQLAGVPSQFDVLGNVTNNLGCNVGDVALVSNGVACNLTSVTAVAGTQQVTLLDTTNVVAGASLSCMGGWGQIVFAINNNRLERNGAPIQADIVNIQAQYGVSAIASSNQVTQWVDASAAPWSAAPLAITDRNRIKAIRVAVVARNGLLEKENVTVGCSAASPNGPCAWADIAGSPAPKIDLSGIPNWQRYRYRVFETIIPLRNMIWSRNTL